MIALTNGKILYLQRCSLSLSLSLSSSSPVSNSNNVFAVRVVTHKYSSQLVVEDDQQLAEYMEFPHLQPHLQHNHFRARYDPFLLDKKYLRKFAIEAASHTRSIPETPPSFLRRTPVVVVVTLPSLPCTGAGVCCCCCCC